MVDKLLTATAPGRISAVLDQGLRGHHPLFAPEEIRAAFAAGDDALVSREEAVRVGQALVSICKEPFDVAQGSVGALPAHGRVALIRLYFRLLERAEEDRRRPH